MLLPCHPLERLCHVVGAKTVSYGMTQFLGKGGISKAKNPPFKILDHVANLTGSSEITVCIHDFHPLVPMTDSITESINNRCHFMKPRIVFNSLPFTIFQELFQTIGQPIHTANRCISPNDSIKLFNIDRNSFIIPINNCIFIPDKQTQIVKDEVPIKCDFIHDNFQQFFKTLDLPAFLDSEMIIAQGVAIVRTVVAILPHAGFTHTCTPRFVVALHAIVRVKRRPRTIFCHHRKWCKLSSCAGQPRLQQCGVPV